MGQGQMRGVRLKGMSAKSGRAGMLETRLALFRTMNWDGQDYRHY